MAYKMIEERTLTGKTIVSNSKIASKRRLKVRWKVAAKKGLKISFQKKKKEEKSRINARFAKKTQGTLV